jgi:hypothetical protein
MLAMKMSGSSFCAAINLAVVLVLLQVMTQDGSGCADTHFIGLKKTVEFAAGVMSQQVCSSWLSMYVSHVSACMCFMLQQVLHSYCAQTNTVSNSYGRHVQTCV